MRILFDKNVPVGVRTFLPEHDVRTVVGMGWPDQLQNGELLEAAEQSGFDVMVTSDQNIRYQQNLAGRKLALVVPGSNIWPVVRKHARLGDQSAGVEDDAVPAALPLRDGRRRGEQVSTLSAQACSFFVSGPPV